MQRLKDELTTPSSFSEINFAKPPELVGALFVATSVTVAMSVSEPSI